MFTKFRNYFITGVALIFPIAITIIIIRFLVIKVNSYILNPLVKALTLNPYLTEHSIYIAKALVFIIVILLVVGLHRIIIENFGMLSLVRTYL